MSYYRDAPGYGTQQFTFAPPPRPAFRPEPTWGGRDYYNAAAISPDMSLYDNALNRVRSGAQGVGFHEARHWHRRAYGGLVDLSQIAPNELGAAAGYEAYRNWIHNSSMYEPLMPDDERQREAMVGLAVAEVTRLWHTSGRRMDRYGLQIASEAAAATASIIMGQWSENEYAGGGSTVGPAYGSGPMAPAYDGGSTVGSAYGGSYGTQPPYDSYGTQVQYDPYGQQAQVDPYGPQPQIDPYAFDNAVPPRRSRRRRRASSIGPPTIISSGSVQPVYGSGTSSVGMPPYSSSGSSIGVPSYQIGSNPPGSTIMSTPYQSQSYTLPQTVSYQQPTMMPTGGSILTNGLPQSNVMYQQPMAQSYGQPGANTIIIPPPERHHRHRSRSRHRDDDREERRRLRRERRYSDVGPTGIMGMGGAGAFGNPAYPVTSYGVPSVVAGKQYRY